MGLNIRQTTKAAELMVEKLLAHDSYVLMGPLLHAEGEVARRAENAARKFLQERRELFSGEREKKALEYQITKFLTHNSIWGDDTQIEVDGYRFSGDPGMLLSPTERARGRKAETKIPECVKIIVNSKFDDIRPHGLVEMLSEADFELHPTNVGPGGAMIGTMPCFNLDLHQDGTIISSDFDQKSKYIQGSAKFIDYDGSPKITSERILRLDDQPRTYIVSRRKTIYAQLDPGQQVPVITNGERTVKTLTASATRNIIVLAPGYYKPGLQPENIASSLNNVLTLEFLTDREDLREYGISENGKYDAKHGCLVQRPVEAFVFEKETKLYSDKVIVIPAGSYYLQYQDGFSPTGVHLSNRPVILTPQMAEELEIAECDKLGKITGSGKPKLSPKSKNPPGHEAG